MRERAARDAGAALASGGIAGSVAVAASGGNAGSVAAALVVAFPTAVTLAVASAIVVAPDTVTAASARSLATHHAATSDAASSRGGDARVAVRGIPGRLYAKESAARRLGVIERRSFLA